MRNRGHIVPITLAASALLGLVTAVGLLVVATEDQPTTRISLSPTTAVVPTDNTFITEVVVTSTTPVNAYAGLITFDAARLQVERIDYNTSIADLWAETPWYQNGAGTIQFAGGSTRTGGFIGTGTLLSITFRTITPGDALVQIEEADILKHDGLGTAVGLSLPIEALFTVATKNPPQRVSVTHVSVQPTAVSTDLTGDHLITVADVSVFFYYLARNDSRADFNGDGHVTTADLSILTSTYR